MHPASWGRTLDQIAALWPSGQYCPTYRGFSCMFTTPESDVRPLQVAPHFSKMLYLETKSRKRNPLYSHVGSSFAKARISFGMAGVKINSFRFRLPAIITREQEPSKANGRLRYIFPGSHLIGFLWKLYGLF